MSGSALALQSAMREALLAHAPLLALLGGGHVFDEVPRGEQEPYVAFAAHRDARLERAGARRPMNIS